MFLFQIIQEHSTRLQPSERMLLPAEVMVKYNFARQIYERYKYNLPNTPHVRDDLLNAINEARGRVGDILYNHRDQMSPAELTALSQLRLPPTPPENCSVQTAWRMLTTILSRLDAALPRLREQPFSTSPEQAIPQPIRETGADGFYFQMAYAEARRVLAHPERYTEEYRRELCESFLVRTHHVSASAIASSPHFANAQAALGAGNLELAVRQLNAISPFSR
ncbi:hypothetical protein HY990_02385 [Candidatus Micrarchaeota archaeon]|nr:hypothetical protein [Candidatus Micrarchaeota archaeon]